MKLLNTTTPIYLCVWNEGSSEHEIVEVHTQGTLFDEYKNTNLFSEDTGEGFLYSLDFLRVGDTYTDDNMTIKRIY